MYSEILDRNKNDCSLPFKFIKERTEYRDTVNNLIKKNKELIAKEIIRCHKHSKGKKAVVLPIGFVNKAKKSGGGTHANALVFNTLQMTAEHFEPHGIEDYSPSKKGWLRLVGVNLNPAIAILSKELKKQAKEQGLDEFKNGLKYVKPIDVCPSESMYKDFKGVQDFDRSKKESVDFEGFQIKEVSGYCQLWTYFLLDLRLKTLDKPPQEVLKEYATYRDQYNISIGQNPNKTMMGLIRGYSKNYFNIIRQMINEGKFTLEEFLKYRDINSFRGSKIPKDQIDVADQVFEKISAIIFEEASKILDKVMKDAKM